MFPPQPRERQRKGKRISSDAALVTFGLGTLQIDNEAHQLNLFSSAALSLACTKRSRSDKSASEAGAELTKKPSTSSPGRRARIRLFSFGRRLSRGFRMRTSDGRVTPNRAAATTSFRAVRREREPGLSVIDAQSRCDLHRTAVETECMVAVTRHHIKSGSAFSASLTPPHTLHSAVQIFLSEPKHAFATLAIGRKYCELEAVGARLWNSRQPRNRSGSSLSSIRPNADTNPTSSPRSSARRTASDRAADTAARRLRPGVDRLLDGLAPSCNVHRIDIAGGVASVLLEHGNLTQGDACATSLRLDRWPIMTEWLAP